MELSIYYYIENVSTHTSKLYFIGTKVQSNDAIDDVDAEFQRKFTTTDIGQDSMEGKSKKLSSQEEGLSRGMRLEVVYAPMW